MMRRAYIKDWLYDGRVRVVWGLLFLGYRQGYYGWEILVKIRNCLVVAITLIPTGGRIDQKDVYPSMPA